MKLLFVALTKHQYRYFRTLKENLYTDAKLLFLPTLHLSMSGWIKSYSLDTRTIEALKYKELDRKYQNPLIATLYKIFLKAQIPFVYSSVYGAIKRYEPDFVVFWNGKKFHQAIGVEAVKILGTKTVFFENGLLPHTTQMDFHGVNASNSMPREVSFYKNLVFDKSCVLPQKLQQRIGKKSKKALLENLPPKYIFVPFQVAYDTQIIQHSPWIKDMRDFFDLIVDLAAKSDLCFVIKEHPSDRVSDYTDLRQKNVKNIYFSTLPTQELIENADAVMTINSTVGIEGLLFDKRVIVLGEAFFAIDGIVRIAASADEVLQILQTLESWKTDHKLIENFLKYLQCIYLIPGDWREPTPKHFEAIQQRLRGEMDRV